MNLKPTALVPPLGCMCAFWYIAGPSVLVHGMITSTLIHMHRFTPCMISHFTGKLLVQYQVPSIKTAHPMQARHIYGQHSPNRHSAA